MTYSCFLVAFPYCFLYRFDTWLYRFLIFTLFYVHNHWTHSCLGVTYITLENHCTRTAQSSRVGCRRRGHKIVYLTVIREVCCQYFTSRNILCWLLSHLSRCISAKQYVCELSDSRCSAWGIKRYFSEKEEKTHYVLEFMLTLDKIQNISTSSYLTTEHLESYCSFLYCPHSSVYRVFWPSDPVVYCNMLISFNPPRTGTCKQPRKHHPARTSQSKCRILTIRQSMINSSTDYWA